MGKFRKGKSGNPAGRKPGTSQAAKLRQAIENDLPDIIQSLVDAAKSGDTAASKLLLDRAIPALKPQQQAVIIPGIDGDSLTDKGAAIIQAMGNGAITPDAAQSMLAGLSSLARINEIDELEQRVRALEETKL